MSEFHPNRLSRVRTKPALTKRRLLESWPLLVWVGVLATAMWVYSSGIVFSRMNGAVDVDHQLVTPAEDGHLLKVLVKQGDLVPPGGVVAEMDSRKIKHQMLALVQGIAADRREQMLQLERTRLDLHSELRGYEITRAEDNGKRESLERDLPGSQKPSAPPESKGAFTFSRIDAANRASLNAELAEIVSRKDVLEANIKGVQGDVDRVTDLIGKIEADITNAGSATSGEVTPEVLAALTVSERGDLLELKALLDGCQLRAPRGGIVERVDKVDGAYVLAGESVVQVVHNPNRIVAFLPQDQLSKVHEGTPVWVTPSHSRDTIYETHVLSIGSRVNSVPDTTSMVRNSFTYGRNVTIAMPAEVIAAGPDARLLVPGQTVIVHTRPPGDIDLFNRLFHTDKESMR